MHAHASGWRRGVIISACLAQLPNDAVERSGDALRTSNLVLLRRFIPIKFERPAFGAMLEETAQRQAHLDTVNPAVCRTGDTAAQDMNRQRDHDVLVLRQVFQRSAKVLGFKAHDILGIHAVGMWGPIVAARRRAPAALLVTGVAPIGRAGMLGGIAAPGAVRE